MKKYILLVLFLSSFKLLVQANNLEGALKGAWLCTKILDSNSQPTVGKFGASDEYLKFNFNKSELTISESSFDPSLVGFSIKYAFDHIDLIPGSVYKIPEQVYHVRNVTKEELILATLNSSGDPIYYYFTHESLFVREFEPKNDIIDLGYIVIKHLKLNKGKAANRVSQYIIPNTREYLNASPTFNDLNSSSFGHYFSNNFKFPEAFPVDSMTNEMVVDFNVLSKGIDSIKIIHGINDYFDQEVIVILEKSSKKWLPLKVGDKDTECRVRLHLIFYLGKMKGF